MKKQLYSLLLVICAAMSTQAHAAIITQDIFLDSIDLVSDNNPFNISTGKIGSLSYDSERCVSDPLCLSFGIVSGVSVDLEVGDLNFDETMEVLGIGNTTANLIDVFNPEAGVSGLFANLFDGFNAAAVVDTTFFIIDPFSEFLSGTVSFGDAVIGNVNGGDAVAVSEPASLALLVPGLFALMFTRRKAASTKA